MPGIRSFKIFGYNLIENWLDNTFKKIILDRIGKIINKITIVLIILNIGVKISNNKNSIKIISNWYFMNFFVSP